MEPRRPSRANDDLDAWSWMNSNRSVGPDGPTVPNDPYAGRGTPLPPPPPAGRGASLPPPPPPPIEPTGRAPKRSKGRGPGTFISGAVVGGLVGALVAAGIGVALDNSDDDGGATTGTVVVGDASKRDNNRAANTIVTEGDINSILDAILPATVAISAGSDAGAAAGSGFVITEDGYIVTNAHVVAGANSVSVVFTDGQSFDAEVVGSDETADLAVLKIDGQDLPTAQLGDSDAVQVGDAVVAVGNALALDGGPSVTSGIISGLDRDLSAQGGGNLIDVLQTDAAISPGNSGGPLVNARGEVIGINTAIADPTTAENIGFVIPISHALPIIDQLREGRAAAFLGVSTAEVTPALAEEEDLSVDSGAYVTKVTEGSGAEEAGVQVGDVIVEIDGQAIETSGDVQAAVRSNEPGDSLPIVIVRDGETIAVDATLGERPEQS